ncbi:sirohydrochlorin chelatase [Nakamurella sp. YIM 132087]|uniref:Sirohydrochlorin chelatase n=1 Tax=Nakamurella alba TaxID=2665158 RepID=A0A7K1FFM9_9ACTN|nr:CbiX/SirB N-terminal domain-containing protein [Nakamurella alba]MTD12876.1 sirohydrochlorin chelatase [Nakamurella alba]
MTGPALIGLAHGSRDPRAAAMVGELMAAVGALRPGLVARPAFLELSEPGLLPVVRETGPAVVVPLLFGEAFHATADVPDQVAAARAETGAALTISAVLGTGDEVLEALQVRAAEARIDDARDILLLAVGSSHSTANAAVEQMAARWSARRTGAVRTGFATCAPRAEDVLDRLDRPGIVPLFLAPGLLLDKVLRHPSAAGCPFAAPLGTGLAALVLQRYDEALAGS